MTIMPAAFVAAQDKGISTVKDGQTAVGTHSTRTQPSKTAPLPFRNVNCGVSGSPGATFITIFSEGPSSSPPTSAC